MNTTTTHFITAAIDILTRKLDFASIHLFCATHTLL